MSELELLRRFVREVAAMPDPTQRPEDDIDALYVNERKFVDVIHEARRLAADLGIKVEGDA